MYFLEFKSPDFSRLQTRIFNIRDTALALAEEETNFGSVNVQVLDTSGENIYKPDEELLFEEA